MTNERYLMERMTEFLEWMTKYDWLIGILVTVGLFLVGYILETRSRRIQRLLMWNTYRDQLRAYADEVIETITVAEGLCEANPQILGQQFWNSYNEVITRLSALRDKGKFILPNFDPSHHGTHKLPAYQGFRDEALDCVTSAYFSSIAINFREAYNNKKLIKFKEIEILDNDDPVKIQMLKVEEALGKLPNSWKREGYKDRGWSCKSALVEAKRQFVSTVQIKLAPRLWSATVEELRRR